MRKFEKCADLLREFVLSQVATERKTLLVYEDVALKWSARMQTRPVSVTLATVSGTPNTILTLTSEGLLSCCFLGTDSEQSSVGMPSGKQRAAHADNESGGTDRLKQLCRSGEAKFFRQLTPLRALDKHDEEEAAAATAPPLPEQRTEPTLNVSITSFDADAFRRHGSGECAISVRSTNSLAAVKLCIDPPEYFSATPNTVVMRNVDAGKALLTTTRLVHLDSNALPSSFYLTISVVIRSASDDSASSSMVQHKHWLLPPAAIAEQIQQSEGAEMQYRMSVVGAADTDSLAHRVAELERLREISNGDWRTELFLRFPGDRLARLSLERRSGLRQLHSNDLMAWHYLCQYVANLCTLSTSSRLDNVWF